MIARLLVLCGLVASFTAYAGDRPSDLKLSRPVEGNGHRWYIISAAAHKRVLVSIRGGTVSTLDVSADFPYSVTLLESPTARYKFIVMFADRQKGIVTDSFGVTAENSL